MVAATFPQRCGNVVKTLEKLSCCNIFQESLNKVPTKFVVRKHLHNIMATFIHFDKVLRYSQCCGNLSAKWENPSKYQDMLQKNIDGVKSDAHKISLADFIFHFRKNKCP